MINFPCICTFFSPNYEIAKMPIKVFYWVYSVSPKSKYTQLPMMSNEEK